MMREEELGELLNELADASAEPVRGGLAEDIKQQIPHRLMSHRGGLGTINVVIDLRISKLAAAAVIIITMVLCASLLGGRDSSGGIIEDGRLLAQYLLGGEDSSKSDVLKDVVYYPNSIEAGDSKAVLMQEKLYDGRYRVKFVDLSEKIVTAEELIELQAQMLMRRKSE